MRTVQQILEDAGYEVQSYSGHGMDGKECLAVGTDSDIGRLFADVLAVIEADECTAMSKAFRTMRQNSLGMGTVVYFPRIAFEP